MFPSHVPHLHVHVFNDNYNMMLVVDLLIVFMLNFAMNKMVFRVMTEYIISQEEELESSFRFFLW